MREPVLAARVSIGAARTAHIAAVTESGRLVHLAVGEDGSPRQTALGEITAEDLYDVAIGSDGTVHALLVKTYLRFSKTGRSAAPAGRCERIQVTDAQTFCVGPLAAGFPDSQDRGGWEEGLGQLGPQQARKFVLSAFNGNGWSALAVLERDTTWQVLAAEIVPDHAGTVHILYLAYGPLDASLNRRTLVRLASFRIPEGSRAAEALPVVDVWELDPEVRLPSSPDLEAARLRPGTLVTRARYGLTQSAGDRPLLALARPAGAGQTIVGAGASPGVQIGADPTEVVLLEEGRLLRKLPPRAETTGWTTLVLSTLLAPGGGSVSTSSPSRRAISSGFPTEFGISRSPIATGRAHWIWGSWEIGLIWFGSAPGSEAMPSSCCLDAATGWWGDGSRSHPRVGIDALNLEAGLRARGSLARRRGRLASALRTRRKGAFSFAGLRDRRQLARGVQGDHRSRPGALDEGREGDRDEGGLGRRAAPRDGRPAVLHAHGRIVPGRLVGRDRRQPPHPLVDRREVGRGIGDQLLEAVDHEVGVLIAVDVVLGAQQPLEIEFHAPRLGARRPRTAISPAEERRPAP